MAWKFLQADLQQPSRRTLGRTGIDQGVISARLRLAHPASLSARG